MRLRTFFLLFIIALLQIASCKKSEETFQKPVIDFVAEDTLNYPGDFVSFLDASIAYDVPAEWEWHFEGGTPEFIRYKTDNNGIVVKPLLLGSTYETPGLYSVTLTINTLKGKYSLTKNNFVKVVEDTRPIIHGSIPESKQIFSVRVIWNYETIGYVEGMSGTNDFQVRAPMEYLGKTVNLYCMYTMFSSDEFSTLETYYTTEVEVKIENNTYIQFPIQQ